MDEAAVLLCLAGVPAFQGAFIFKGLFVVFKVCSLLFSYFFLTLIFVFQGGILGCALRGEGTQFGAAWVCILGAHRGMPEGFAGVQRVCRGTEGYVGVQTCTYLSVQSLSAYLSVL